MDDHCVSFELLDQVIVVESRSPGFIADLRDCFEDVISCESDGVGSADLYLSVADAPTANDAAPRLAVTSRPENAMRLPAVLSRGAAWNVARRLVQWVVDSSSGYYVFHSGSVARDGRGILLPGSTNSGKSTLTVALALRGFDVLSDEVGAIRADDRLQMGFGRALSIRSPVVTELGIEKRLESGSLQGDAHVVCASVLGLSRTSAVHPSLVVSPAYREGASVDLRPLRGAAAVMALYEAFCSQQHWKVGGLDFVIELVTSVPCFELIYSNMHDAARVIEKTFDEVCASESIDSISGGRSTETGGASR